MKKKHVTISEEIHTELTALSDNEMQSITTCAESILGAVIQVCKASRNHGGTLETVLNQIQEECNPDL
jgi:hypothetical protein